MKLAEPDRARRLDIPRMSLLQFIGERVFDTSEGTAGASSDEISEAAMGVMRILDSTGDTMITWDTEVEQTVRKAEAAFERMVQSRHMAFARPAGAPAEEATLVRRFDARAEEIILVRSLQGG